MFVREATQTDELEIRRILDGAMLEYENVERCREVTDVFVAGDRQSETTDENGTATGRDRILGTMVLVPLLSDARGKRIDAIAVRRRHRGRGIGRALVERALERERRLIARFDADVRPFYETLEFSIEPIGDDRFRGTVGLPR